MKKKTATKPPKAAKTAKQKWGNGTTYTDDKGVKRKRIAHPGTKRGDNYCARSSGQKQTPKVKQRRKDWGCRGKKSVKR